ncbi:MAG TPA: hypothetical protein DCM28_04125 [Phycisphaerales bacterium]|nr:hypothetical protein [Phycisphaerales bacterium]HCD34189.1 hypothetical protein [Phycisphaerales bacterium]|tara:strand:+ start:166915 stop:168240 length:1326 start_codon:yes stop_codon:yes gene_type:complete
MTLPSQVGRISGPGARVTRKRRRGTGPSLILPIILLAALCGGGYFAYTRWLSPQDDAAPETYLVDNQPANIITHTPSHTDTPAPMFPLPTSTDNLTTNDMDEDPLVYDSPTLSPPAEQPSQPTKLIPLPREPENAVTPKLLPLPVEVSTPVTPKPVDNSDIEDAPEPVPGTPVLAPAAPILAEDADIAEHISRAMDLLLDGKKLEARVQLSHLLFDRFDDLAQSHASIIRSKLKELSDDLIFSKRVIEGDTVATYHLVRSGDYLGPIARSYKVTYPLLEKINKVKATRIWAGMKLKVIKGPFHAIVDKTDYLMDVYLNDDKANKVYVATYPIGLGEQDSTPIGIWRVRPDSKVTNPSWADPRTGQVFQPDDPANPIGEYWIGLQGMDDNTSQKQGYGIHGTTEAQSIGQQMSMGCIRMRADDLVWIYDMLVDKDSTVTIRR